MGARDHSLRLIISGAHHHLNIKIINALLMFKPYMTGLDERAGPLRLLGRHRHQHLKPAPRVAAKAADGSGSIDARGAARIGHGNTHGVFNDIAAAGNRHLFRLSPQQFARFGCAQRDRDRLRAAHRVDQLLG